MTDTPSSLDAPVQATSKPEPPVEAKKPRRRPQLLVGLAALVVVIGAGGGYLKFSGTESAAAAGAEEHTTPGVAVPLDPFVVNLADPGGTRFLRVNLSLVVDETHAKELLEDGVVRMRTRSAILELLAQQSADLLVTPEGKAGLKRAIADGAAGAVKNMHVTDVLFSEFVVQF